MSNDYAYVLHFTAIVSPHVILISLRRNVRNNAGLIKQRMISSLCLSLSIYKMELRMQTSGLLFPYRDILKMQNCSKHKNYILALLYYNQRHIFKMQIWSYYIFHGLKHFNDSYFSGVKDADLYPNPGQPGPAWSGSTPDPLLVLCHPTTLALLQFLISSVSTRAARSLHKEFPLAGMFFSPVLALLIPLIFLSSFP